MLLHSLFSGTDFSQILINLLISIPAAVIAITFHELSHGIMAYWLGDPTAKYMGRLTANPAAHFDLLGTLCMILVGFGWAKPVPFDPRYFKRKKLDTALVALAGPLMNLLIAFLAFIIWFSGMLFAGSSQPEGAVGTIVSIALQMVQMIYIFNLSLMLFNLVPIPPLDGSKVLFSFLPARAFNFILQYERYGGIILLIVLFLGLLDWPLNWLLNLINTGFFNLAYAVIGLFIS